MNEALDLLKKRLQEATETGQVEELEGEFRLSPLLDEALTEVAPTAEEAAAPAKEPRTPSARWWLWSALAASVVGGTVATMALAASEEKR